MNPLEQQPKESNQAFAAFKTYLELGPNRTLAVVAEKIRRGTATVERWSARFDWPARIHALSPASPVVAGILPAVEPGFQPGGPSSPLSTINHPLSTPPSDLPFTPHPSESTAAFETFLCYFDLGQARSLPRVAKLSGLALPTVREWAKRFDWRTRVRAYNTHLLRTRLAVETDARRNQAELRAQRALLFQDAEWKAAEKLLRAALHVLDVLLTAAPDKVNLTEVARALDIASKLGRLATGLSTENVAHAGGMNVNLQFEINSAIKKIYGPIADAAPDPAPAPVAASRQSAAN